MRQDCDNLRAEIEEKNVEIEKQKDAECVIIETWDSRGDYTPVFRHAVYKMLNANTPHTGVEDVIRAVLALADKELMDFPSTAPDRSQHGRRKIGCWTTTHNSKDIWTKL